MAIKENIAVRPVTRDHPDLEKLARAMIDLAVEQNLTTLKTGKNKLLCKQKDD